MLTDFGFMVRAQDGTYKAQYFAGENEFCSIVYVPNLEE